MLNTLACLELGIDSGGGGGCMTTLVTRKGGAPFLGPNFGPWCGLGNIPAAAAGSMAGLESPGASRGLDKGLLSRSRPESCWRAGGERERRSKRERRGSGSVWSKRERFTLRRSVSSIACVPV